jgi:hypothetical protein
VEKNQGIPQEHRYLIRSMKLCMFELQFSMVEESGAL